ncbi:MAG: hypothetical protein ACMG6E_06670 [Candidatus Roizmanbacteria bacterium]
MLGYWSNDKANGFGVYCRAGGESSYKGEWSDDK